MARKELMATKWTVSLVASIHDSKTRQSTNIFEPPYTTTHESVRPFEAALVTLAKELESELGGVEVTRNQLLIISLSVMAD